MEATQEWTPEERASHRRWVLAWLGVWAMGCVALGLAMLRQTEGFFVYTLDDPYIHLSVARTILQGGYGLQVSEFSSPSSSILFPWLLALTMIPGPHTWGPLAINLLAAGGAVVAAADLFWRFQRSPDAPSLSRGLATAWMVAILLCLSPWALPMTGMEHALHVLLVAWAVRAVILWAPWAPWPRILVAAIVLMPLIRFEGTALSLGLVGFLVWRGHVRVAVVALAAMCAALGLWMVRMWTWGLPILPSSVQVKSAVSAEAAEASGLTRVLRALLDNYLANAATTEGGWLLAMILLGVILALKVPAPRRRRAAELVALLTVLAGAHLVGGAMGWLARYEVYAVAGSVLFLVGLFRLGPEVPRAVLLAFPVLLLAVAWPYIQALELSPRSSARIHQQQYQMHRLVVSAELGPVAANDVGWISFQDHVDILDLWGLGSEEVRLARRAGIDDAAWMEALVARRGARWAMIYSDWFTGKIPASWVRVGSLEADAPNIPHGRPTVEVFATDPDAVDALREALERWGESLPRGSTLHLRP